VRYQFQSEYGQFSWRPRIFTEAIKVLIGVNVVLFVFQWIARSQVDLARLFGLSPGTVWPLIWQPMTYMFIHGGVWHVAINMFVLWMFGSELEMIWGRRSFLKYYFITGVGSGLVWLLFNLGHPYAVLIGASGAVYGILTAYGLMFPNRTVYIYFLFPVKVKYFVIFIGAVAFLSSLNRTSNISHLTHLSGMLIGYLYLKSDHQWKNLKIAFRRRMVDLQHRREERRRARRSELQQEIDRILDKINQVGYDGLTEAEKETLYNASRKLSRDYREKD
jgi:membrane associated rhomboid family serine protease